MTILILKHSKRKMAENTDREKIELERFVSEEKQTCDHCGQKWEKSFFCKKCSNKFLGTEMEETPNLMWCGEPGEEMGWEEVDQYSGDVCGNCCTCHYH